MAAAETVLFDDTGFRFVRIQYTDIASGWGRYRGRGRWATDWPAADLNLTDAIRLTTKIPVAGEPLVLRFTDERIFEYPVVYLTEPGYWQTSDREVEAIRTYLDRGGFLIIDDFHDYGGFGPQWFNMYSNIKRVFPDREPEPLPDDHPIWSVYFDIDPAEAPSTKPGFSKNDDVYFAIYDDNRRMMCVISYNQDIGDGWEWPNRNFADASTISYQMAINFIFWALSH